ncbi:hypothetical protein TRVA0_014S00474 [Trichomonascus vanleenenianus]|uniref:Prp21p n=1 Tax=Trichomonascus vanleenenianus TaxID=2268995 RepID=UPI003ECA6D1E
MENGVSVPEGIIIPPPEVKKIVTKTAGYVHRNGRAFGEKIQRKEGEKSKKFSFLNPTDAYNPYFEWVLSQLEQGVELNAEESGTPSSIPVAPKEEKKARSLEFAPEIPPISPLDLDIIKQTALYVAKNGLMFQKHIVQRSGDSAQFEFLKQSHSLNPLYQSFVGQYRKVLDNDFKLEEKSKVLHNARLRAEQEAVEREKRKQQKKEEEAERIAYAQIDWHDFAVVETIEFTHADMEMELPLPITIEQIQYASLEEKRRGVYKLEEAPPDYDSEEEPQQQQQPLKRPPPRPQPVQEAEPETELQPQRPEPEQVAAPAGETPVIPGMKIKPKGTSRLRKQQQSERKIRDPITGQLVPESEYDQHMRISQLNPEYKKYKEIEQQRVANTNLSSSEEAARNLKRLVNPTEEEQEIKKRKTVQWDGYSSSRAQTREAAAVSQEEKRRLRKEQHERENAIGPKRG